MSEDLKNPVAKGDKKEGTPTAGGEQRRSRQPVAKTSANGKLYIDYKENETLRRMCASNGKINSRRRTGATALEQRMLSDAIKRARYMALMPYVANNP
ncbi:MAG: 30S ribosomal protein S18 [Tepidisphaeraceae bacterium]